MKKVLKVLAIYSILISVYLILANFTAIGQELTVTSKIALVTLFTLLPIIIFSVLILFFLKSRVDK